MALNAGQYHIGKRELMRHRSSTEELWEYHANGNNGEDLRNARTTKKLIHTTKKRQLKFQGPKIKKCVFENLKHR